MAVVFARNLLFSWQLGFKWAKVDCNHVRACALLNGAHNDIANFAGKLPHQTLVSDGAESGGDYLFCRISGDSTEVFWGYINFFIGDGAVFGYRAVVNRDLAGLAV